MLKNWFEFENLCSFLHLIDFLKYKNLLVANIYGRIRAIFELENYVGYFLNSFLVTHLFECLLTVYFCGLFWSKDFTLSGEDQWTIDLLKLVN